MQKGKKEYVAVLWLRVRRYTLVDLTFILLHLDNEADIFSGRTNKVWASAWPALGFVWSSFLRMKIYYISESRDQM